MMRSAALYDVEGAASVCLYLIRESSSRIVHCEMWLCHEADLMLLSVGALLLSAASGVQPD